MATILVASMYHEVNSFVPGVTTLEEIHRNGWATGPESLLLGNGADPAAGAAEVARDAGVELIPVLMALGKSGPLVEDRAYEAIRDVILSGVREHRDGIDGVYLALHGAMTTESLDGSDGPLIASVREVVGDAMPIAVSFDLHCHFTELIARSADIVAGFQTCPHVDMKETGERAMRLLLRAIETGTRPVMRYRKIRMTASSEHHDTRRGPMHEVMLRRAEIERETGLDITILPTQPWIDAPGVGWSVVAVGASDSEVDGDEAQRCVDELATMLWERRERFLVHKTPIDEVLALLRAGPPDTGPIVVSDGADSTSAGSTGDGVSMLRALVESGASARTVLSVTDPAVSERCFATGVGARVDVELGGRLSPSFHRPVRVSGIVESLHDGRYQSIYPPFPMDVGRTAVLAVGPIKVVITERPAFLLDMALYRHVGLEPSGFDLVIVKSAGGYREHYEPIASRVFDIDTTGPAASDLTRLPFRKLDRPLWPFDPDLEESW